MKKIWCSISSHGYGHAAQVVPILNELGREFRNLHVILRTTVPAHFFETYLRVDWELQAVQQDIGCLQLGPLDVDVPGTWQAYQQFHQDWKERVDDEARDIAKAGVNLVMANISHLGIEAGRKSGRPVVALASLCWDQILESFRSCESSWQGDIIKGIQDSYAHAHHLLRLFPGIDMPAFPSTEAIGPTVLPRSACSTDIRERLNLCPETFLVSIGFGGVPLTNLPLDRLEAMEGFHFVVSGIPLSGKSQRMTAWEDLKIPFAEVLEQSDIVMTKPGYSTIVTAVDYGIPIVYVRRDNFAEESGLVAYAHRFGRAYELPRKDFESGDWQEALNRVLDLPMPARKPPQPGHGEAAAFLKKFL